MIGAEDFQISCRDDTTISELWHLAKNHLDGVYVMPSLKSLNVWHGILFVRGGPYQGGIFRFIIFLQDGSAGSRPLLIFTTPVFHPQVHPTSGTLNLDIKFPQWERGKNRVWQILDFMKTCFYSVQTWRGTNKVAINVIHRSLEEFKQRAAVCAAEAVWLFDCETMKGDSVDMDSCDNDDDDDDGNILRQKNFSGSSYIERKRLMLSGTICHLWTFSCML